MPRMPRATTSSRNPRQWTSASDWATLTPSTRRRSSDPIPIAENTAASHNAALAHFSRTARRAFDATFAQHRLGPTGGNTRHVHLRHSQHDRAHGACNLAPAIAGRNSARHDRRFWELLCAPSPPAYLSAWACRRSHSHAGRAFAHSAARQKRSRSTRIAISKVRATA